MRWLVLLFVFCLSCGATQNKNLLYRDGNPVTWTQNSFPIRVYVIEEEDPGDGHGLLFRTTEASWRWEAAISGITVDIDFMIWMIVNDPEGKLFKVLPYSEEEYRAAPCGSLVVIPNDLKEFRKNKPGTLALYKGIHLPGGVACTGHIFIRPDLSEYLMTNVLVHELGHALGLNHDEDDPFSIMYPYTNEYLEEQSITEEDAAYVRGMMDGRNVLSLVLRKYGLAGP